MSQDHPEDVNHGDSVAAWTSVIVVMVGFVGVTTFYVLGREYDSLTWASVGVIVVGSVLGPILAKLGFGQKK